MAFVSAHPKLVGTAVAAIFAGLAFYFPEHAVELGSASAALLGALHIQRPGDVKAGG